MFSVVHCLGRMRQCQITQGQPKRRTSVYGLDMGRWAIAMMWSFLTAAVAGVLNKAKLGADDCP